MNPRKKLATVVSRLLPQSKATRKTWLAALVLILALVLLPWLVKLDGKSHADWEQFLGRFHPLAVHLPIGLLVLVPVLEVAGKSRPALRESAGFVLGFGFAACLAALSLGFLLAHGGGSAGPVVVRHMWSGIVLTICVLLCLLVRPWWSDGRVPHAYPAMLTASLLVLMWAAHQGGSLTHGGNYLTEYMPSGLKRWIALGAPPSNSFYARRINPILDTNCGSCHGPGKVEGDLRMDSYDQLMRGGKDGPVVIAGKPDSSLLLQRVTLPPDHKGFMPAEGKPPLRAEQIALIRAWILEGATPTTTTLAGISERDDQQNSPPQPVGDYSAFLDEIRQMDQSQGAKLKQVSTKPEDGLILYTVDIAPSFGDAQLAQFLKFAPFIVEADLGRTAVTNASFDTLSRFSHLRALHLEETKITGDGLAKLDKLPQLSYLNLSGTEVTAAAVAPLKSLKNLRHFYLYNTPAQPASEANQAISVARNNP